MNRLRIGNFTSSDIVKLMSNGRKEGSVGEPFNTYVEEKIMERKLGRPLSIESNDRALLWGKLCESFAFDKLGLDYSLNSDETIVHPDMPYWVGTPDGFNYTGTERTVIDIKCPWTIKSFCSLVDPLYDGSPETAIQRIREQHKDGEKYYWQLVSNACITGCTHAELIVFMPYKYDLSEIRQLAEGDKRFYFIWASEDNELPYLMDSGYYRSINKIRFEVPLEDKQRLTERVNKAGGMLDSTSIVIVSQSDGVIIAQNG